MSAEKYTRTTSPILTTEALLDFVRERCGQETHDRAFAVEEGQNLMLDVFKEKTTQATATFVEERYTLDKAKARELVECVRQGTTHAV